MRKIVLSLAAAGAALIAASPATAQYYPQQQSYGYSGYGYNNGFGFNNGFGQVRALQVRIDNVERQINRLDRYNRIGDGRADQLRFEAKQLERQLRYSARNGLNPYEARDIELRIARLEQRVQYSLASGYGRYGYGNGYNGYGYDRDRDGRDDRWEHRSDRDDDRDDD
jgi:hypothetical protein